MENKRIRILVYIFSIGVIVMSVLTLFNVIPYLFAIPVALSFYFVVQAVKVFPINKETSRALFLLSSALVIIGFIGLFI